MAPTALGKMSINPTLNKLFTVYSVTVVGLLSLPLSAYSVHPCTHSQNIKLKHFFFFELYSRVILTTSVTVESKGWFLGGFVFFEGLIKILAPMPLAKVWADSVAAPNPRWPP